jgi:hypothetical protein
MHDETALDSRGVQKSAALDRLLSIGARHAQYQHRR